MMFRRRISIPEIIDDSSDEIIDDSSDDDNSHVSPLSPSYHRTLNTSPPPIPIRRMNLRRRYPINQTNIINRTLSSRSTSNTSNNPPNRTEQSNVLEQIPIEDLPTEFLEPIRINISETQFANMIPKIVMDTNIIEKLHINDVLCVICQYDIISSQPFSLLECKHIFHIECAKKWFTNKCIRPTCPCCRKDIRELKKHVSS